MKEDKKNLDLKKLKETIDEIGEKVEEGIEEAADVVEEVIDSIDFEGKYKEALATMKNLRKTIVIRIL